MAGRTSHRLAVALLFTLAALAGLAAAVVVVLNLHIALGLEEGYAASPRDVWERSPLLGLVDIGLLVGGPLLVVVAYAMARRRPRGHRTER